MKSILSRSLTVLALCMLTAISSAATVSLSWQYSGPQVVTEQILNSLGSDISLAPDVRTYQLLNQGPGAYTVTLEACNTAGCSDPVTAFYTIPDTPNSDDLTLTITVSRD